MDVRTADGRTLRLHGWGERPGHDRDLVVCVSGIGASGRSWRPVAERLSPHVAVVAHDRAGYGGSDPAPVPTLDASASDLDAAVAALPHRQLLVVGHSWGGPIARMWASGVLAGRLHGTTRGRMAGLLLLDPSDEHDDDYFSAAARVSTALQAGLYPALARTGVLGRLTRSVFVDLPEPIRSAAASEVSTPTAVRTIVAESRLVASELAALRSTPPELEDLPVWIVSGMKAGWGERALRAHLIAAHRASASASPQGRHIEATGCGHLIPQQDPALVADLARSMLR